MKKMSQSEAGKLGAEASRPVVEQLHQLRQEQYASSPSLCRCCNNKLPYSKRHYKFCNRSCSATFNNKNKVCRIQICKTCGNEFVNRKSLRVFCSQKCMGKHIRNKTKQRIDNGEHVTCPTIKRFLIEERGIQCEICKITKWMDSPVPLVLDHIDGNGDNNDLDNLRLVCGNCDMLLPTYKGKNVGKGRHYRRVRYSEGKSY